MQIKTQEEMSIRWDRQILDLSVNMFLNQRIRRPVQREEIIIIETDAKCGNRSMVDQQSCF